MVKNINSKRRGPDIERVIFIDFETTDLILEEEMIMPYILTFSAIHHSGEKFHRLVMPLDHNFTIAEGATKVNGYTKRGFLKEIRGKKQDITQVLA